MNICMSAGVHLVIRSRTNPTLLYKQEVETSTYQQACTVQSWACGFYNALGFDVQYLCYRDGRIDDKGYAPTFSNDDTKEFQELPELAVMLQEGE